MSDSMEDDLVNSATPELSNITQTVLRDLADDDADIADVSVMLQPDIETETIDTLQVISGKICCASAKFI